MRNSKLYRKIYEDHYGPIPKGYHVHHIDGNHENNDPENLMAVTPEEHARLHVEMGLMWKGGDRTKWIVGASEAGVKGGTAYWKAFTPEEKTERAKLMASRSSRFSGKKCSLEHREKLSKALTDKPLWKCACGKEMKHLAGNIKQHQKVCKAW